MLVLKKRLNPPQETGWLDLDPCKWNYVGCSDKRVIRKQIVHQTIQGAIFLRCTYNVSGMLNVANFECPNVCMSVKILEFEVRNKNRSRDLLKDLNVGDAKTSRHDDLEKTTNNFNDPIEKVGSDLLFHGFRDDGQEVTVKT